MEKRAVRSNPISKLCYALCAFIAAVLLVVAVRPAYADEVKVVDSPTNGSWQEYITHSTEQVGRIWTDKTVQMGESWEWGSTGSASPAIEVEKGNSDFLVSFSALSSTSNVHSTVTTPLDVVLVLDVSGSMDEYLYTPVYNGEGEAALDKSESYYIEGQGVNGYREVEWSTWRQEWGYNDQRWRSVTPKVSVQDASGVQFYERTTKMAALRDAAYGFIDSMVEANEGIDNPELQHQLSVVKFAAQIRYSNRVIAAGNEYTDQGYNYTQPLEHMDLCDEDLADTLKGDIDDITPSGMTQANYGLQVALSQIENYGRDNARKVVVFFTDGEPNSHSGFHGDVAANAIDLASELKASQSSGGHDALVYTIGIFESADPDSEPTSTPKQSADKFNSYMHAVSSNYPAATASSNGSGTSSSLSITLGNRSDDLDANGDLINYYRQAESASELTGIFDDIFAEINRSTGSPTNVREGYSASEDGYITFTDQLGDYMKVDGFKGVVFADQFFTEYTFTSEKGVGGTTVTTYVFEGENEEGTGGNVLYPSGKLSDLVVRVTSYPDLKTGDTVEIAVPATLIPLYSFEVDGDEENGYTMKSTKVLPGNILYGVSLKDGVREALASGGATLDNSSDRADLVEYVANNTSDDKQVQFYTNKYSGIVKEGVNTVGDATAHYDPSLSNPFYYLQEDTYLYWDEDGVPDSDYQQVTVDMLYSDELDGVIYYPYYYFKEKQGSSPGEVGAAEAERVLGSTAVNRDSYELVDDFARVDEDGYVYLPAGTPKVSYLHNLRDVKSHNETETADMAHDPHWDNPADPNDVNSYLGNNGLLAVDLPSTISVSKLVEGYEGIEGEVLTAAQSQTFFFKAAFTVLDDSGRAVPYVGKFTASVLGVEPSQAKEIELEEGDAGVYRFELKHGQTLAIADLPVDVSYEICELSGNGLDATPVAENGAIGETFKLKDIAVDGEGVGFGESCYVAGTTAVGSAHVAEFTNTFRPVPLVIENLADIGLEGEKKFTGRAWKSGDEFTFVARPLHPSLNPPMPQEGNDFVDEITVTVDYGDVQNAGKETGSGDSISTTVPFTFPGTITFTEPGTYEYHIFEADPVAGTRLPGVSYSLASYELTVEVEVNTSTGKLEIKSYTAKQAAKDDDSQAEDWERVLGNGEVPVFTNAYDDAEVHAGITLTKNYANGGNKPLQDRMFHFKLEPLSAKVGDGNEVSYEAFVADGNDFPMPEDGSGKDVTVGYNVGTSASFPQIAFEAAHAGVYSDESGLTGDTVGAVYAYRVTEVIPEGATAANNYTVNGMKYDPAEYKVYVRVQIKNDVLEVTFPEVYKNGGETNLMAAPGAALETVLVFSNSYAPEPAVLDGETALQVQKTFVGRDMQDNESFSFTLTPSEAVEEAIEDEDVVIDNGACATSVSGLRDGVSDSFSFGKITFWKPGIYLFTIEEDMPDSAIPGVTYDTHDAMVTVTVTEDSTAGKLVANASYTNGGATNASDAQANDKAAFTNTYAASDADYAGVSVRKTITDRALEAREFTFAITPSDPGSAEKLTEAGYTLQGEDGSQYIATTNPYGDHLPDEYHSEWRILSDLAFTQEDVGKPYGFLLTEIIPADAVNASGVQYGNATEAEKKAGGFVKNGVTYDASVYEIAIGVTDDYETGKLVATTTIKKDGTALNDGEAVEFLNTYAPSPVTYEQADTPWLSKILSGRDWNERDSFEFTFEKVSLDGQAAVSDGVVTEAGKSMPLPAGNADNAITPSAADQTHETVSVSTVVEGSQAKDGQPVHFGFGPITFKAPGEYFYQITELEPLNGIADMTYSTNVASVYFDVEDDGKGSLVISQTQLSNGTFTNVYTGGVDYQASGGLKITKVLTGRDAEAGEFEFVIKPVDSETAARFGFVDENGGVLESRVVSTPAAAAGQTAYVDAFGDANIVFTHNDIGKTYTFKVKESVSGGANATGGVLDGITYDTVERTVYVAVSEHSTGGVLVATWHIGPDGTESERTGYVSDTKDDETHEIATVGFTNAYDASTAVEGGVAAEIKAVKSLENKSLEANAFEFALAPKGTGTYIPVQTVKNAAGEGGNPSVGAVDFAPINYRISSTLGDEEASTAGIVSLEDAVSRGYAERIVADDGALKWAVHYTVYEVTGSSDFPKGVSAATASFDVVVEVVDLGNGVLEAKVNYPNSADELTFSNVYSTGDPVEMTFAGSKVLKFEQGLTPPDIAGEFTFTLTGSEGAPMPEVTQVVNDSQGNVVFGPVKFDLSLITDAPEGAVTEQGGERIRTFTYKVTESGAVPGVENDENSEKTFTVWVKDDGAGGLETGYFMEGYDHSGPLFTFTNTYSVTPEDSSVTGDGRLEISKQLKGRDLKDGEFEFELVELTEGADGVTTEKVVATGKSDTEGNVSFSKVRFYAPGEHEYVLREKVPEGAVANEFGGYVLNGVTYDKSTYKVNAFVEDDNQGGLDVYWEIADLPAGSPEGSGGEAADDIVFNNAYKAAPAELAFSITKRFEGADLKEGQFSFQLLDEAGNVVETVKNAADGTVAFSSLKFETAGDYIYTIVEVNDGQKNVVYDTSAVKLKVVVVDEGTGTLSARVEVLEGDQTFENAYVEPLPDTGGEDEGDDKPSSGKDSNLSQTGDGLLSKIGMFALLAVAAAGIALAARSRFRAVSHTAHRR